MSSQNKEISVIVPVFNSAASLPELVNRIVETLNQMNLSYEVIFVDDFSSDNSWEVLKKIRLDYHDVSVVRLSKNYGQHNATFCGLQEASGSCVITLDDDLEQPPESIPELYAYFINEGMDLLYASPLNRKKNVLRNVTSSLWNLSLRISKKGVVNASSFRLMKREITMCLVQHKEPFVYIDSMVLWYTKSVGVKEIAFEKRKYGASNYSTLNLYRLNHDLGMHYDTHILKIMKNLGSIVCWLSFLLIFYYLFRKIYGNPIPGYTSLMIISLFSSGSILWGMGYLGIYIGKMFRILNKEPQYQVSEKISLNKD